MKDPRTIIRRPILTEQSLSLRDTNNKYTFEVDRRANKIEIKHAVEKLFEVDVLNVATLNVIGKKRRVRTREKGKRPDWKKQLLV